MHYRFDFPGAENASTPAPSEPKAHSATVPFTSIQEARNLGARQETLNEIEKLRDSINALRSELGSAADDIPGNNQSNVDRQSKYWNNEEDVQEEPEEEEEEEVDEWEEYLMRRQLVFPHVPRPSDPYAYIPGTFKSMSRTTLSSGENDNKSNEGEFCNLTIIMF